MELKKSKIFMKEVDSRDLENWKMALVHMSVSLFTFYTRERSLTRWFSFSIFRHYQVLFAQAYSVRITPIYIYLLFS